jgi:uncharacterized protein YyaL (SSP411 family)
MKPILFPLMLLVLSAGHVRAGEHGLVKWLTVEEAVRASTSEPRPILVDVYTGWCGWCKKMDKTTYSDSSIAAYINARYWPVKFDAESKDTVLFQGKAFVFVPDRKAHELALSLLNEKMSYPSTVFLRPDWSMIQPVPGYLDTQTMRPILDYVAGGAMERGETWETFKAQFRELPVVTPSK